MTSPSSNEQRIASVFDRVARHDPVLNCFTLLLADAALDQARALDRRLAIGETPGPLAGVPFAVKNLFDVEGIVTLAGSRVLASGPAATRDATVVGRLRAAGAILVGCLNMDEFAYGFTTENAHYGTTANPHATDRIAGGSSGGSAAEGGALHLHRLRTQAMEYDPAVRERLLAGALLPSAASVAAQRFRSWYRRQAAAMFERFDVLLAPATPTPAPLRAQATFTLDGVEVPARANLGLYTQPISFVGLPVVSVPVRQPGALPIGVQIITRPFNEALGLRIAAALERLGVVGCEDLAYD